MVGGLVDKSVRMLTKTVLCVLFVYTFRTFFLRCCCWPRLGIKGNKDKKAAAATAVF